MSWYVHPSKQLRDDELPPELVVTNRDGSIEQAYVPYNASERLQAENAKLREERNHWKVEQTHAYSNWEDAHKRVTEVEAENAELREQVARHKEIDAALARADEDLHIIEGRYGIHLTNAELYMLCDAVYAINAKLRKFAAEIYEDQCDDCDKWKYRDRMRELGIEVPE